MVEPHVVENAVCPACGSRSLRTVFVERDLPHFGRAVLVTSRCSSCGYSHTDVIELEDRGHRLLTLDVDGEDKLNYLVVRSSSCRLEIPEAGLELLPGPFSNGFITTVEGVLDRFETAVLRAVPESGEGERRKAELLEWIRRAKGGKERFTLVLEDPRGISGIIPPGA